jgi:hypothetical protein
MWQDADLIDAVENENTLKISSLIIAEFNLNNLDNIEKIGNYRYRPTASASYSTLTSSYDVFDAANNYTNADISYQEYSGTDEKVFTVENNKLKLYYSLGDCFLPFRPRSGINKARFIDGKYIDNIRSSTRPRYYMPSRKDFFKYWSSYRVEDGTQRGISSSSANANSEYFISDAAPFVSYVDPIYANRIVIKMQTNVGSYNLGTLRTQDDKVINDPLYNYSYASVPKKWKVQKLNDSNAWVDIISFSGNSLRSDGSPIVPKDGHVEIFYGVSIPAGYSETFTFLGYTSESLLPEVDQNIGNAYVVGYSSSSAGILKVWNGSQWTTQTLEYKWSIYEDDIVKMNGLVTTPVNPMYYMVGANKIYREFEKINGVRVVVETMNAPLTTLDLIELSPRLAVNLSNYTEGFNITKTITNDQTGIPVGGLSVSVGDISLVNYDNVFSEYNTFNGTTGSILAEYTNQNTKFALYEKILNVNGADKYIPIKTMYAEKFPKPSGGTSTLNISLRDLFFRLESSNSPTVLSQETSLTFAVSNILDYIGFSNYVFKNITGENDPILPYFFVEPDVSVAEVLNRLAVATQTAMFFDEYNNLIVMSKEYLLPNDDARATDFTLYGNSSPLPNIEEISDNQSVILNKGVITYTTRYIQREVSSLSSSYLLDQDRVYRYKPVLLWEVAGTEITKTKNESSKDASAFALGALALNINLSDALPMAASGQVINNIIDVGESIYWLPRFQGYLYANGEIIKFDAVEFAVPGNNNSPTVWISNNQEYQKYFANLGFNGKIYPTGRIRIYSEPYYVIDEFEQTSIKDGAVRVHGRGQFNTAITEHMAGLPSYWSDNNNVKGINMKSSQIFVIGDTTEIASSGPRVEEVQVTDIAKKSSRSGIIKNFMSAKTYPDGFTQNLKTTQSGTIQSSALVFKGPPQDEYISNHRDMVSYIIKDLSNKFSYRHFGTRMRIIGRQDINNGQIANGSISLYSTVPTTTANTSNIDGGSGGIGIMIDESDGSGYYFEIVALDIANLSSYYENSAGSEGEKIHNVLFYKIKKGYEGGNSSKKKAIPEKLWGGLAKISVDSGLFAGQNRLAADDASTVYDLAIEYKDLANGSRQFYLYINNNLVNIIEDDNPLPIKTNMAPFVRGSSQCMFENIYAMEYLIAKDSGESLYTSSNSLVDNGITIGESLRKYALSGIIQSTYLSNINTDYGASEFKVYFEEFGTIMRECYHFEIKYDQAFPSFYSQIAATFSNDKGFTVSGYYSGPYEAEFLIFNASDKAISLDETTGNYLRILGITFTQETTNTLSVDDYFNRRSNMSDPIYTGGEIISPLEEIQKYNRIKASRAKIGTKEFSLESLYIQSENQAAELMSWLVDKTMRERREIVAQCFPMPHLQLGDIVTIDYIMPDNKRYVDETKRFVISEIVYGHSSDNISQTIRMVEV